MRVIQRSTRKPLAAVVAALGLAAAVHGSSSLQRLGGDTSCTPTTCEITTSKVVSLSNREDPELIPDSSMFLVRDRDGRYFVTSRGRDRILVFDPAGQRQAILGQSRPVGPHSDGALQTGDFQLLSSLFIAPDGAVLAFEPRARTFTRISPELKIGQPKSFSYAPSLIRPDGSFIVAQQITTPDLVGQPIHLVSSAGIVIRSFGSETGDYRADQPLFTTRVVALGSDDTVWAVPPGRYVIDRWNPSRGNRISQTVVRSTWFKESPIFRRDQRLAPNSVVESLWEQDGLLWVLARVADSNWAAPEMANVDRPHNASEYDRTYDWILEAVVQGEGRVAASRRFANAIWARSSPPVLVSRFGATIDVSTVHLVNKKADQKEERK
jgi:hypothetical protein